jgi:hypothetical protein
MACSDRQALNPFAMTFEMCSSIVSLVSSVTPRTLTLLLGVISVSLKRRLGGISRTGRRVKWMRLVLSASNVAPLRRDHCSACRMIVSWMAFVFCSASLPTTHALKSSTKPRAPPLRSIFYSTRSAL